MNWRSFFGAWYAEDVIRVRSNLTVSLGFRDEFSTGWNEANKRAANYTLSGAGIPMCASKPAANVCLPQVGSSVFTVNRATFLPQPRIALAWSPFHQKTVVRAGFGMYNDLQDALGYRSGPKCALQPNLQYRRHQPRQHFCRGQSHPAQRSAAGNRFALLPGGVQPNLSTPTLISYSLKSNRHFPPTPRSAWATLETTAITKLSEPTPMCPFLLSVQRRRAPLRFLRR